MNHKHSWYQRKKLLRDNGWIYNRKEQTWDSSGGSSEFVQDLKEMNDEYFEKCLIK